MIGTPTTTCFRSTVCDNRPSSLLHFGAEFAIKYKVWYLDWVGWAVSIMPMCTDILSSLDVYDQMSGKLCKGELEFGRHGLNMAKQVGKIVEYLNQSQPNPGVGPFSTQAKNMVKLHNS